MPRARHFDPRLSASSCLLNSAFYCSLFLVYISHYLHWSQYVIFERRAFSSLKKRLITLPVGSQVRRCRIRHLDSDQHYFPLFLYTGCLRLPMTCILSELRRVMSLFIKNYEEETDQALKRQNANGRWRCCRCSKTVRF